MLVNYFILEYCLELEVAMYLTEDEFKILCGIKMGLNSEKKFFLSNFVNQKVLFLRDYISYRL